MATALSLESTKALTASPMAVAAIPARNRDTTAIRKLPGSDSRAETMASNITHCRAQSAASGRSLLVQIRRDAEIHRALAQVNGQLFHQLPCRIEAAEPDRGQHQNERDLSFGGSARRQRAVGAEDQPDHDGDERCLKQQDREIASIRDDQVQVAPHQVPACDPSNQRLWLLAGASRGIRTLGSERRCR